MQYKVQVINDPIHKLIKTNLDENNILMPFIEHPIIQRLRYIKQMGMADLVFPSAVHNRFSHSIGTGHIAMKICQHLALPKDQAQLYSIAGLFHDIGHGPFSHAFEDLFSSIGGISHEEWTPFFMNEIISQKFVEDYNKKNPGLPLTVSALERIQDIIVNSDNKSPSIAKDIISSQLDADRLDYLLRDSHFCGVNYGHYDLEWLINCMSIFTDQDGNTRLALEIKALESVEQYLLAREFMGSKIYYHRSIMVIEHILIQLLKLIVDKLKKSISFPKEIYHIPIIKFLQLLADSNEQNKHQFMKDSFKYYKILSDYDVHYLIRYIYQNKQLFDHIPELFPLVEIIQTRNIPYCRIIKIRDTTIINKWISQMIAENHLESWEIGIFKTQNTFYNQSSEPIYMNNAGKIEKLENLSDIVKKISVNKRELYFLYINKSIIDKKIIRDFLSKLHRLPELANALL